MINAEKPSQLLQCDHRDFVNFISSVTHHMNITHKLFQCEYCNFMNMSNDIMKTQIQSTKKKVPSKHKIYSLLKWPLKKKDFDYAHPPYDPKLTIFVVVSPLQITNTNYHLELLQFRSWQLSSR